MVKKILKWIAIVICTLLLAAGIFILYLTITEFRPADKEAGKQLTNMASGSVTEGETLSVLSWNIGYAGLGAGSDFFMDGGSEVAGADKATVKKYLNGIADTAETRNKADITLFQEVDADSTRTYHIDERETLAKGDSYFAKNFSCAFVPYPLPPIGKVTSGLLTVSDLSTDSAERISLPCPFKWPVRLANLKRCLLVTRIPVSGSDKELVIVNLHLEAYDDGSGKRAQMKKLNDLLEKEYKKGNYVIAGGDFNQCFPASEKTYPNTHKDIWTPGHLSDSMLPDGFAYAYDVSTPSCRLNNQPYDPSDKKDTQYYLIDGFILSPNVSLDEIETLDEGFENSDHNPVKLEITLKS